MGLRHVWAFKVRSPLFGFERPGAPARGGDVCSGLETLEALRSWWWPRRSPTTCVKSELHDRPDVEGPRVRDRGVRPSSFDQLEIIDVRLRGVVHTARKRESPFGRSKGLLAWPRRWPLSRRSLHMADRPFECSVRRAAGVPTTPACVRREGSGGDGGESNSPSRTLNRKPLRACPMVCRRPPGRTSAPCRTVQSRVPRSGLSPDYATLIRFASPLNDASTTREDEVASTLTLAAYAARARAGWRLPGTSFCCLINEA